MRRRVNWNILVRRFAGIPLWLLLLGHISLVVMPIINMALSATAMGWFAPNLLPPQYTLLWFRRSFEVWELQNTLLNSLIIAAMVVIGSISVAFPAAYVLARRKFPGKDVINVILLIPLLLPGLTYGIPAARIMYQLDLDDTYLSIALLQMLPISPFVLLMLKGVIAGVPISLEEQAQTLGANRFQTFRRVVFPLIRPGIVAASAWAIAKSISEFGLTFLVTGPKTMPLAVVLYSAYNTPGSIPSDNAALTLWLFVPSVILITSTMRFMKAETATLKG